MTAVSCKDAVGVIDFRKGRDPFVVQGRLAHQERVEVSSHHDRHSQATVHDDLGEHGDNVFFAAPEHLPLGIEQVPGRDMAWCQRTADSFRQLIPTARTAGSLSRSSRTAR